MAHNPPHDDHGRRSTPGETTPSRVVHVRGLPAYTTESELLALCTPFGTVIRVLLLQQQQQAFVQMASVEAASALLTRYTLSPATIRSKQVFFQYSNRTEIKAPMVGNAQQPVGHGGLTHQHTTAPSSDFKGEHQSSANSILLVTVLNVRVPVTLDHLHTIFKPYGDVRKIIIFNKNNVFKALVQMGSIDSAVNAKLLLEGKDMFQGCCHLRIGFSSLQDLRVQQNGPRARDYTVSENFNHSSNYNQPSYLFNQPNGYAAPSQHAPAHHQHQHQHASSTPYSGYASFPQGQTPTTHTSSSTAPPQQTSYSSSPTEKGCVVLVSNLPDHRITPDVLFTLFGVYGDVIRVKILFNKRDTAMIQFATAQQAYLATLHLNHLQVYDKEINVSPSKHTEVSLPRPSELEHTDAGLLTKDYTNSPIHRFKKRSSTDAKNIHPPSQVLHVSNLYDGANENELRGLFGAEQKSPPAVQFFSTSRKQAFVRMESLHDAILALIRLHNYKLGDRYMRVSFSHKEPSMVKDSDAVDGDGDGNHGTGDTGTDHQHSNEGEQQENPQ